MTIDDRYSVATAIDKMLYEENADYKKFIENRMKDELSRKITEDLYENGSIVVIKGEKTVRDDPGLWEIICRQDIYVKKLTLCKNCKHKMESFGRLFCERLERVVPPEFYCADGKDEKDEEER